MFDELGRLLRDIGAASQITAYGYDRNGNPTAVTDPLAHATAQAFDALDRLTTSTDAASGQAQRAWDAQDNQTGFTDPGSVATGFVHDGFGQVIQEASPDIGTLVLERDPAGNLTRRTDGRGVVTEWTYDALGRPLTRSYPAAPAQNVAYAYDQPAATYGIGRLTGWTDASGSTSLAYDARGNVVTSTRVIGGQSYATQYGYTVADRLYTITYPSGRHVGHHRDALGRVSAVTQRDVVGGPWRYVTDIVGWQPFGAINYIHYAGNGINLALTYDQDARVSRIAGDAYGVTYVDLNYTYDDASRITAIADARVPAQNQSFGYDVLDRLTAASGAYGAWSYSYDANGNRTSRSRSGGLAETYAITPGTNRLASVNDGTITRSLGTDGAGSIATDSRGAGQDFTYLYDRQGRLSEVQLLGQTRARYDLNALGERVAKTIPGTPDQVTHFHYDLDGHLIAESDGSGAVLREYVWLGDMPVMVRAGGVDYSILTDHLGTPQRIVAAASSPAVVWDAVWRPFGEIDSLSATIAFPLRLPGQYFDLETGLHYNYQRDYDPATGRYIEPDPVGLNGGENRFAYVGANPIAFVDPEGLQQRPNQRSHRPWSVPTDRLNENELILAIREREPGFRATGSTGENIAFLRRAYEFYRQNPGYSPPRRDQCSCENPQGGTYIVRQLNTGEVVYAGRSSNLDRRAYEQTERPGCRFPRSEFGFEPDFVTDSHAQQRGREQQVFDTLRPRFNQIRPVSPGNPRGPLYGATVPPNLSLPPGR